MMKSRSGCFSFICPSLLLAVYYNNDGAFLDNYFDFLDSGNSISSGCVRGFVSSDGQKVKFHLII